MIEVRIDLSEVDEVLPLLQRWFRRRAELPKSLREELEYLGWHADEDGVLVRAVEDGMGVVIELTPRMRALIGNLRARGRLFDEPTHRIFGG